MKHAGFDSATVVSVATRRVHARIGDIEVLRGVAILMVLVEHLPFNLVVWPSHALTFLTTYCRGWVGVDLFFAISGFVIARGLLPLRESAVDGMHYAHGILAFWIRRAWRLLPSAWLWLVVPLVASIWFNRSGVFDPPVNNFAGLVAGVLDVANFHEVIAYQHSHSNSFPYWSLSLEEQFYLVLPFIMFFAGRWLAFVMALTIFVQFAEPLTLFNNFTRPGALAIGVLLASVHGSRLWMLCEPTFLARTALGRAAVLFLPLIFMGAVASDTLQITTYRIGLIAVLAGVLVWVASYDSNYLMRARVPRRLLMWFGSRSYSIYLVHIPAFSATREIWFRLSPPGTVFDWHFASRFMVTAGVLTLALAEANLRLVEQPLRRRGKLIAQAFAQRVV